MMSIGTLAMDGREICHDNSVCAVEDLKPLIVAFVCKSFSSLIPCPGTSS